MIRRDADPAPPPLSLSRRSLIAKLLIVAASAKTAAAGAQEPARMPRIGMLSSSPTDPLVEAFRLGLRDMGYVEGRNITVEYRWVEGRNERLPGLAAELVRLKVDLIVAASQGAVAAREATKTIPIVMPTITDPVRLGLVASLAHPGGNATGFATQNDELPGKWLELAKETLPRASRVAVMFQPTYDGGVQIRASDSAARVLGLRLQPLKVESADDLATAFGTIQKNRPDALIVASSPLFYAFRTQLVESAARHQLPTIYHQDGFVVEAGGLMSYGPDFRDLFRRSATYVDKILKGAKPGDLPVQQPTKFELVINRRTARTLGLTVPQAVLSRADRVID